MKKYQKPTIKTASLEYEAVICTSNDAMYGTMDNGVTSTQHAKRQDSFWNE